MMELLIILVGISIPMAIYFWRESRQKNPAARWPRLAETMRLQYRPNPPRIGGVWKDRKMVLTAVENAGVLVTPLNAKSPVRLEIGPKDAVEKAAGLIVPDRVVLNDLPFERRFLARATPAELGEAVVDSAMRQKLLHMPDIFILAEGAQVQVRTSLPFEPSELRECLDIAGSVAEAVEGYCQARG